MHGTLLKAYIIELKVQEEMLRYGFDISVPAFNVARYDLLVDTGREILKIQIKKALAQSNSSFTFSTQTQNTNTKTGKKKHRYTTDEVDYFATVWENQVYLIPVDETSASKTIKFDDTTYYAENVLSSYERLSDEELYNYSETLVKEELTDEQKARILTGKCEKCGTPISPTAKMCVPCRNAEKRKNVLGKEDLISKLKNGVSFSAIGRECGVSDNAVRKWCDSYGIPRRIGEIKKMTEEDWSKI